MLRILASRSVECLVALMVVSALTAVPAHAYLDPGSGSYALQVGIAGVLGVLFSVKMFWRRLRERLFAASNRNAAASDPMSAEHGERVR